MKESYFVRRVREHRRVWLLSRDRGATYLATMAATKTAPVRKESPPTWVSALAMLRLVLLTVVEPSLP